ncbi:sarcosine oxidase subunit gamma [Stappia stellulata]|uniref:sarcosine oxidase subunit gamma n=1 Tax=Stappia stellulata TaxID=71235 RepID=UPI001CD5B5A7|nr:sarcosine oxidase subunit gamma family protein [Stappia stellulata]MCA1240876.1 sarcosine oxidase subunit gamma [Stappia stellulata]
MPDTALYAPATTQGASVVSRPDVTVTRAAPLARLAFRGDATAAGKAGAAFGASLPMAPLAANPVGQRAALWLGPDEWLLLAASGTVGEEVPWALARTLCDEIATAVGTHPHALVDVSERNVALIVSGPRAAALLNTQVFLDLDEGAFPVGQVTRTLFTKAEIVLWRTGPDTFVVECWRSFAPYVEGLLANG